VKYRDNKAESEWKFYLLHCGSVDSDPCLFIYKGMRKLGSISCLEATNTNDSAHDTKLVILFHGYGADAYDLQTLSDAMPVKAPTTFLFPQGPLEVPIGPGWTGRAWWKIDVEGLQRAIASGQERDMPNEYPEGLRTIRPQIFKMIEQTKTPWSQIVIGGFSQGAMLATDIFLNAPEAPAGLMILSGALICQEDWRKAAAKRQGSRFFQSHGTQDNVLSHKNAQRLETLLTQAGLKGRLQTFGGGHEIPMSVLQKATVYLDEVFAGGAVRT